jgi:hypothetical protein
MSYVWVRVEEEVFVIVPIIDQRDDLIITLLVRVVSLGAIAKAHISNKTLLFNEEILFLQVEYHKNSKQADGSKHKPHDLLFLSQSHVFRQMLLSVKQLSKEVVMLEMGLEGGDSAM